MPRTRYVVTTTLQEFIEADSKEDAISRMETQGAHKLGNMDCLVHTSAKELPQHGDFNIHRAAAA